METVGVLIETVIDKFKSMWQTKKEVVGFLLFSEKSNGTSLLLVEEGDKMWKTRWFNDKDYIYKTPSININSIFKETA